MLVALLVCAIAMLFSIINDDVSHQNHENAVIVIDAVQTVDRQTVVGFAPKVGIHRKKQCKSLTALLAYFLIDKS